MINVNVNRHSHNRGLESLPIELFDSITSYLSQSNLTALCQVSRTCHRLTIPCLFRKIDLQDQKFIRFLQLWQDGRIPHEYFKHVRWFAISEIYS